MSHASGSNGENSYSPDRERNREAMSDENAKIAKDALFNRKYVEIIFRKCNCVPLTNRESVDVMDMQTWFSLVIDNVKEALDSRDTLLADLRRERDEAREALKRMWECRYETDKMLCVYERAISSTPPLSTEKKK